MWHNSLIHLLYVFKLIIQYSRCTERLEIAVEGQAHILNFKLPNSTGGTAAVEGPNSLIALCNLNENQCVDHFPSLTKTKCHIDKKTVTVNITNISRLNNKTIEGNWSVTIAQYVEPKTVASMLLAVTSKPPENVECSGTIWNCNIHLMCSTKEIYPPAKCIFQSRETKDNSKMFGYQAMYSNKTTSLKPVYYESNCTVAIPFISLRRGLRSIFVSIFPNITDTMTDAKYGVLTNITIPEDNDGNWCRPAIEGEERNLKFDVQKYKEGDLAVDNQNGTISLCNIATKHCQNLRGFTKKISLASRADRLELIVELNNKTSRTNVEGNWTVKYVPHDVIAASTVVTVLYRARGVSCKNYTCVNCWSLECTTRKVYPPAKCLFKSGFKKIDSNILNIAIRTWNSTWNETPLYYESHCSITIPMATIGYGVSYVNVTMFPNVTNDDEDDAEFGTFWIMYLGSSDNLQLCQTLWILTGISALHILSSVLN